MEYLTREMVHLLSGIWLAIHDVWPMERLTYAIGWSGMWFVLAVFSGHVWHQIIRATSFARPRGFPWMRLLIFVCIWMVGLIGISSAEYRLW